MAGEVGGGDKVGGGIVVAVVVGGGGGCAGGVVWRVFCSGKGWDDWVSLWAGFSLFTDTVSTLPLISRW